MRVIGCSILTIIIINTSLGKDKSIAPIQSLDIANPSEERIFSESYIPNSFAFQLYLYKGIYQMKEEAFHRAIINFELALQLNPGSFETYSLVGEALLALNLKSEAMKAFDQSIELNPFYANAYFHRARLFKETGNEQQASQDYAIAAYLNSSYRRTPDEPKEKSTSFKKVFKSELKVMRR